MSDLNEQYPFMVSVWIPGNDNPKSIFEKGRWLEMARCRTKDRAKETGLCLSFRHPGGVQVAELVEDESGGQRWQGWMYWPPEASKL